MKKSFSLWSGVNLRFASEELFGQNGFGRLPGIEGGPNSVRGSLIENYHPGTGYDNGGWWGGLTAHARAFGQTLYSGVTISYREFKLLINTMR